MPYADLAAFKAHLNDLITDASFWPDVTPRLEVARRDFVAAGPEICAPLAELLWAHYESLAPMWAAPGNAVTRALERIPTLTDASQVWAHIEVPYEPEIEDHGNADKPIAIPFQVNIAWYPGHSVTAVFQGDSVRLEQ